MLKRIVNLEAPHWSDYRTATLECGHTRTVKGSLQKRAKCYQCAIIEKAIARAATEEKKPDAE